MEKNMGIMEHVRKLKRELPLIIRHLSDTFLEIYWKLTVVIAVIVIVFLITNYYSQKYDIKFRIGPVSSDVNEYFTYDSQNRIVSQIIISGDRISDKYIYEYNDNLISCLHYVYNHYENVVEIYESIEDESGYLRYSRYLREGITVREDFYEDEVPNDGIYSLHFPIEEAD